MGRPSAYKEEYEKQAEKLALLGATDVELGNFFGVSEQTINAWKKSKEGFLEALKRGKDEADMKVAESLYKKACKGDTTAAIFWLKNRRTNHWRDKQEVKQDVDAKINIVWKDPELRDSKNKGSS